MVPGENGKRLSESINYLLKAGIDYEFRSVAVPGLLDLQDMTEICQLIKGCNNYFITPYRNEITLDAEYRNIPPFSVDQINILRDYCIKQGIPTKLRGMS